MERLIKK